MMTYRPAVAAVMVLITNRANAVCVAHEGDDWLVKLTKDASFLNKPRLRTVLQGIPRGAAVQIDATRAAFIDHDIRELIHDFEASAPHRGITVAVRGMTSRTFPLQLPAAWRS